MPSTDILTSCRLSEVPNTQRDSRLVRWSAWAVAERAPDSVVHGARPATAARLPVHARVRTEYASRGVRSDGAAHATNAGDRAVPFGCGTTYLALGTAPVDPLELRVPARTVLEANERSLPTGTAPVAGTRFDFRGAARRSAGAARPLLRRPGAEP